MTTPETKSALAAGISEDELLECVRGYAKIFGWEFYHTWYSRHSGAGWPDCALVRPPEIIFAELKRESGRMSKPQWHWHDLLKACPAVEMYVWRPSDLNDIIARLRRPAP